MTLASDIASATLRHLPEPFALIDENECIQFINHAGENLLNCTLEDLQGSNVREFFNLRKAHDLVNLETSATWVNDARLEFRVTNYPVGDGKSWSHLSLRYPAENPNPRKRPFRSHTHSHIASKTIEADDSSQQLPVKDDFWQGKRLTNILDRLPTVVAAVSKDGAHVYQNQAAFETLGSIRWSQNGLTSWLERQWGSTHGDGTPFTLEEYPIYKCAILGQTVADFETCFEGKSYLFMGAPQYDEDGEHIGGCVFAHDITSTKQKGEEKERNALARSDNRFTAITDDMEQLVWKGNSRGEALSWNRRWYEYTGATTEDSLGMLWFNFVHPDDVGILQHNWSNPNQNTFIAQYRLRAYDGTFRWFLARARREQNSGSEEDTWLGTSTDITELTAALVEARSTREHLLSITSAANVDYWVIEESDSRLILTSLLLSKDHTSPRLYGYLDRESLLDRDVQHVLPATLIDKVRLVLSGDHDNERDEMLVEGEYWRTRLTPLKRMNEQGSFVLGVVGTAFNITNEKVKDQALQRADTARDVAVQSSKFKSEFLARMSHEIRTPIGGILGMAQLLAGTTLSSEQRIYLDGISRSGDGLLVIINDILDFSKIEMGKLDVESIPFDLKLVLDDVFSGSQHGPHMRSEVAFKLEYNVPSDLVVIGDRNRVMQILLNLTSNSLKFTRTGSVTLRVLKDADLTPQAYKSETTAIRFEVIDTGLGIPADVLKKLFTPFTQADSTICRRFGGTGLGLTIAKQLAKLMNGSLELTSTGIDGEGSIATCIIPFTVCSQSAVALSTDGPERVDGLGAQILVVEDNKINQVIATTMLKKCNFKPRVANHGREALDILHAGFADGSYIPDLILMDCQMPVLDGYEATKILRRDDIESLRNLPVIAMTASAIRGDKEKCLSSGMNDYISKPVKQSHLVAIVMKWLDRYEVDFSPLRISQAEDNIQERP